MKTQKLKHATAEIKTYPSYLPANPTRKVKEKLDRLDSGRNSYQQQFDAVGRFVLENFDSFDLSTFYACSKSREIPSEEMPVLFDQFCREMVAQNRIREVAGCYESSVWVCV